MNERYAITLSNGLRVVMERSQSRAVYCGIVVKAGTRHEDEADSGMAHFVEHMTFKGTSRRTARQLTGLLERRGGDLCAFTSKQETVYYAQVLPEDFPLAADLLCDIVFYSLYPQTEINKEVEVICDEIGSYRDAPAELIFDEFESRLFPNYPLGRDVLGRPDRLRQYTTFDALRFTRRYYRPDNCVFYLYGNIDFERARRAIETAVKDVTPVAPIVSATSNSAIPSDLSAPFFHETKKETHQAHVVIGTKTIGGNDADSVALQLLNNLLGGPAPNSRLNLALRERAALVYSVDSYATHYPDTGSWMAYFGCDPADVNRCLRIIRRELLRLIEKPLSQRTLCAIQRQFTRQVRLACDNAENYALALGKTFAHYDRHRDIDNFCARVEAVTSDRLQALAARYLHPDSLSTLIYR